MRKTPPTLQEVADLAGVSKMTVSRILRNHPHHNQKTRDKVLRVANEIGYKPNPLVSALMAKLGHNSMPNYAPAIGLIHVLPRGQAMHPNMYEFRDSVRDQAAKRGFEVEEFHLNKPGMTPKRLFDILFARGIHGVIIEHFWTGHVSLDVDLSKFAAVAIGFSMTTPNVHRVDRDHHRDTMTAVGKLRELGYRRIGIANITKAERIHFYRRAACFQYLQTNDSDADFIPPLVAEAKPQLKRALKSWIEKYEPDAIVSQHVEVPNYLDDWGYKVPRDIGFLHLDMCKTMTQYAGIYSNWKQKGAVATNQVIDQLNRAEFGVPEEPMVTMVNSKWIDGPSLRRQRRNSETKRATSAVSL